MNFLDFNCLATGGVHNYNGVSEGGVGNTSSSNESSSSSGGCGGDGSDSRTNGCGERWLPGSFFSFFVWALVECGRIGI